MRVIKRYDNRKLYDTQTSKTVNLGEIADMIRQGDDIQVIDSQGHDITPKILGQIFLQENLETKQLFLNKFVLQGLIQEGQNIESVIKKFLLGGIGLASLTREKLDEIVNELVKRGELAEDQRARFVKELLEKGTENIHKVMDKVAHPSDKEEEEDVASSEPVSKAERITSLEQQIASLKQELAGLKSQQKAVVADETVSKN
ncbi:MAG: polyhydroxyalkanoate biosynthesis repressor PhaR [Candidatus Sericytochromatia bacterium]|nr:polyhydroxyalkanoate biosynthesis repressor PhaR [Candidatus Sericytochromatia bacterium]